LTIAVLLNNVQEVWLGTTKQARRGTW